MSSGLLRWSNTESTTVDLMWPRHYAALLKYQEEHGTCNVPKTDRYRCNLPGMGDDGTDFQYHHKLGYWLATQRQTKNNMCSPLTPEREALLQALVDKGT